MQVYFQLMGWCISWVYTQNNPPILNNNIEENHTSNMNPQKATKTLAAANTTRLNQTLSLTLSGFSFLF